ncbi:hypothetical protein J6590_025238 [Homalodisca vitripennis]|nr:hypothetical protein J6590_025238 [Homalodisca vitripennis]
MQKKICDFLGPLQRLDDEPVSQNHNSQKERFHIVSETNISERVPAKVAVVKNPQPSVEKHPPETFKSRVYKRKWKGGEDCNGNLVKQRHNTSAVNSRSGPEKVALFVAVINQEPKPPLLLPPTPPAVRKRAVQHVTTTKGPYIYG